MGFDAFEFDELARNVFAPAYPLLARQIVAKTGTTAGTCLDVGSGGGYLGLALAEVSTLTVCLLDNCADMHGIATANIAARNLRGRTRAVLGDVHDIPLPDSSISLVVSRGSLFFWQDLPRALREIWRVMAPGGQAYLGGGFGSRQVRDEIAATMRRRDPSWTPRRERTRDDRNYDEILRTADIPVFDIQRDESGFWIQFGKQQLFHGLPLPQDLVATAAPIGYCLE